MIYLDTSVLGALFFREPGAEILAKTLEQASREGLLVSAWGITEMASVAAIKKRMGVADGRACQLTLANFQRFVSSTLQTTEVEPQDFRLAFDLILREPLRSGDALHIAIAMRAKATLATLDKNMGKAAVALGVQLGLKPA